MSKLKLEDLCKGCGFYDVCKTRNEIRELKELFKECRDEIEYLRKHYKGNIDHFKNNTRLDKEINKVIGEKK